jgi:antitoxin component YwqK of YwqJK toxin-antitoxin module
MSKLQRWTMPIRIRFAPVPGLVLTSALVLHDGRLWRGSRAFTCLMIEHYPSGAPKSRSAIFDGMLHGVSDGWHTNRVLQVREHFVRGISHGRRVRWDEQGRKVTEAQIVEGKMQAFWRWHDNGQLAEEIVMKDGKPDGRSRAWFPSELLKTETTVVQGKVRETRDYARGATGPVGK